MSRRVVVDFIQDGELCTVGWDGEVVHQVEPNGTLHVFEFSDKMGRIKSKTSYAKGVWKAAKYLDNTNYPPDSEEQPKDPTIRELTADQKKARMI